MITLQYFNGQRWEFCSKWTNERMAWISLGGDDANYRTIDADGNILTSKQIIKQIP